MRPSGAAVLCAVRAVLVTLTVTCSLQAQNRNVISGVVKNASGEPVEGALVRVRNADPAITFLVVTQRHGRYSTPGLLPGKYTVEAIGGDYQSNATPPEVGNNAQIKMDLVLSAARTVTVARKRRTRSDYAATMPDGPAKQVVLTKCVSCHDLDGVDTRTLRVLGSSRQEWEEDIVLHKYYMEDPPDHLSEDEVKLLVDYMTKNFSLESPRARRETALPPDANSHLPRTLLKGPETSYVGVEFNLRRDAAPHDISVDSQGIAWIAEHGENEHTETGIKGGVGRSGRIDPKTLSYSYASPPAGKWASRVSGSRSIRRASSGMSTTATTHA